VVPMRNEVLYADVDTYLNDNIKGSLMLKCFTWYVLSDQRYSLKKDDVHEIVSDLKDYKNIASLGYLIALNFKVNTINIEKLFLEGMQRIKSREISKTSPFCIDDIAILGIVLAVKKLKIDSLRDWLLDVLGIRKKVLISQQLSHDYIHLLSKYVNGETLDEGTFTQEEQAVFATWFLHINEVENSMLKQQCILFQRIWKKRFPYFNDYFFDVIAVRVVDLIIESKFKNELLSVEDKYNKAMIKVEKHSEFWSFIVTLLLTGLPFVLFIYILYYIFYVDKLAWSNISIFLTISGIPGLTGGLTIFIKFSKLKNWIYQKFYKFILKRRGLE
jgi:hypothetical protein